MQLFGRISLVAILLSALAGASCSKDPAVAKQEFLVRGNRYFDQQKYNEAVIEYKNALVRDAKFAEARYKLAQTYDRLGDSLNAEREYVNAADLMPDDPEVQVRAGLFLAAAGRIEEAKARALKALAKDPKHLEAHMLLAQAIAGLRDIDGAITEIENAIRMAPGDERSYVQLGAFRLRQGQIAEAEKAYQEAVTLDPKSIYAVVGFAKFYLAMGRMKEAEEWVKKAVALSPDDFNANRTLAVIYLSTNRVAEAEAPLKVVSKVSLIGTPRLVLADYYFLAKRNTEARQVLESFKDDPALYSAVRTRLSALEMAEGHADVAKTYVDEALKKNPADAQAALLKAQYLVKENQLNEARDLLKTAVAQEPRLAAAHYWLAVVSRSLGDTSTARAEFAEAQRLAPSDVNPKVQLAEMDLAEGKFDAAMAAANDAVSTQPNSLQARVIRVDALMAQRKLPAARQEATALLAAFPKLPVLALQLGRICMMQRDFAAAGEAFQRAFQSSNGDVTSAGALIEAKIAAGKVAEARSFAEEQVAKSPTQAVLRIYAAHAYKAGRETAKTEAALREALRIDPANLAAYVELTQLYVNESRLDDARTQLEAIVTRNPKESIWARTLIAMSLHVQDRKTDAKKRYEEILQQDPQAAIAANNLATLLTEENQNPDRALDLAQTAKRGLPNSPEVNDTLGMAYLKKGLTTLAVSAFEFSVQKDGANPEYRSHLGLAYAAAGQKDKARASLEKALSLNPNFAGAADARRALAALGR